MNETHSDPLGDFLETIRVLGIMDKIHFYTLVASTAIGIFGNPISVVVYLSKEFQKKSLGTYFAVHGIMDTIFLLSMVIYKLQPYFWPQYLLICQLTVFAQIASQITTSWIQVINSIDRVILITMPKRMLFMRKIKFQITAIVTIITISVLLAIPRLLYFYQGYGSYNEPVCAYYDPIELFYYYVACMLWYLVLPFIIMLICSIIIIRKFKKKGIVLNRNDDRKQRDKTLTITLLAGNIYFLIITLPFCIISILDTYMRTYEPMLYYAHLKEYGVIFYTFVLPINLYHGTMFIVHIVFNKTFLKVVRGYLSKYFRVWSYKDDSSLTLPKSSRIQ